jgi:hypothetical protein
MHSHLRTVIVLLLHNVRCGTLIGPIRLRPLWYLNDSFFQIFTLRVKIWKK